MVDEANFFKEIKRHPERFYIIHYSSERLFDEEAGQFSPRITSIVLMHYQTRQILSYSLHTVAEELEIGRDDVEAQYDKIERELLTRYFDFVRDNLRFYWIHWNMRSVVFGFEHLEHRYRTLARKEPPTIPIEARLNLNDIFKQRYGSDYAPDPRMKSLMALQGELPKQFMSGEEESAAFKAKEFIRMNASTISKVQFFRHAIELALKGKLKTAGRTFLSYIDRLLESRVARALAFTGTVLGLISWIAWLVLKAL